MNLIGLQLTISLFLIPAWMIANSLKRIADALTFLVTHEKGERNHG